MYFCSIHWLRGCIQKWTLLYSCASCTSLIPAPTRGITAICLGPRHFPHPSANCCWITTWLLIYENDSFRIIHIYIYIYTYIYIFIIARSATSLHQIHTGSCKYMCKQRSKIVETIPKTYIYIYIDVLYKINKNTPAHMGHISFLSWNPSLAWCPALDPCSSSWARNWSATRPQFWAKFRTLHRRREFFQWHCCLLSEQCTLLKEMDGWQTGT